MRRAAVLVARRWVVARLCPAGAVVGATRGSLLCCPPPLLQAWPGSCPPGPGRAVLTSRRLQPGPARVLGHGPLQLL